MYKWLLRMVGVAVIGLLVAHIVLNEAGIPKAEQRPVDIALMAGAGLCVAICVGRFVIRPKDLPAPGRSEADYHAPPRPD